MKTLALFVGLSLLASNLSFASSSLKKNQYILNLGDFYAAVGLTEIAATKCIPTHTLDLRDPISVKTPGEAIQILNKSGPGTSVFWPAVRKPGEFAFLTKTER